jgi:hypothetical protein
MGDATKLQVFPFGAKFQGVLQGEGLGGTITTGITASATETQAAATPLKSVFNVVSTAGATDAVLLKDLEPGEAQFIKNATAVAIQVFPPTGRSINGGTVDAADAVNMGAGATRIYVGSEEGVDIASFIMNV